MAMKSEDAPKHTADGAANASIAKNEDDWDEARLEAGLKKLQELHIQARKLRTAIPRLIEPMAEYKESPQVLFAVYRQSIASTTKEIQTFKELVLGEEAKKVVDHAMESAKKNPGPVKPWMYKEHPGWSTREL